MTQYKAIKVDGKKVDEHRYIMEQAVGRKLCKNEVVHHINGDKTDNRLCNLEIMDRAEHSREHMKNRTLKEETKQKISKSLKGIPSNGRKLSDEQVERIKSLHSENYSQREIAEIVGTNHSTVCRILNGKYYSAGLV